MSYRVFLCAKNGSAFDCVRSLRRWQSCGKREKGKFRILDVRTPKSSRERSSMFPCTTERMMKIAARCLLYHALPIATVQVSFQIAASWSTYKKVHVPRIHGLSVVVGGRWLFQNVRDLPKISFIQFRSHYLKLKTLEPWTKRERGDITDLLYQSTDYRNTKLYHTFNCHF